MGKVNRTVVSALRVRLSTARNPQLAIMTAHLYVIDSIYRFALIFRCRDSTNGKLPCGFWGAVGIESVILVAHWKIAQIVGTNQFI